MKRRRVNLKCTLTEYNGLYEKQKKKAETNLEHTVIQLFGVDRNLLDSEERCREKGRKVTESLGLIVWKEFVHKFSLGISIIFVISESHLSIHTWPEYNYVHFDVITCLKSANLQKMVELIEYEFQPEFISVIKLIY
ncbi:S-adenosylmethionine decarboxylase proenzyme [subsurface metagenome]